MTVKEKLSALREIMDRECIDAYIVSGTDPHNSEYLPAAWKQREWLSGFTGSLGTVVVTTREAGLWTDSRYFIQAAQQLDGSGIELHKLRIPGAVDYPEWLANHLPAGSKVGLDSFCTPVEIMKDLQEKLSIKEIRVIEKTDLLGELWLDRPALPENPVFLLPAEISGKSTAEKLLDVRSWLEETGCDYFMLSSLDEIAWLYNLRCDDIAYNPVAISYAVVGRTQAWLFIKHSKVPQAVQEELATAGIELRDYHHLFLFLKELDKKVCFGVDPSTLNYAVYHQLVSLFQVREIVSPVIIAKAIKNSVEIEGIRKACLQDGIAMSKFFYWLEQHIAHGLSEAAVAERLTAFRAENEGYVSDSFDTISAYGENAALPHYSAKPGNAALLKPHGLYLVDSGAQYLHGTTDITRTISLGELTHLEKEDYTLVLKGMIALAECRFPKGTSGCNIDVLARQPLWQQLRNFGHGTGHGIGFFLNVHEGPQSIRQELKYQPLIPGMLTSDEPGIYREGSHGIRHENMLLCIPFDSNEFGEWLGFETVTLCYFDTSAILVELLNEPERQWLNTYHQQVYKKIAPYLTASEAAWLKAKTQSI